MKCYSCANANTCSIFKALYAMSRDFSINDCNMYIEASATKYKRIAEQDELLRLIYDYFTDQVEGHDENETRQAIMKALLDL